MFLFVDDSACLLGDPHCDYDSEAVAHIPKGCPLIVCGLPNEVQDVCAVAQERGRVVSSVERVYDDAARSELGVAPVLCAPAGMGPVEVIAELDRNMRVLPPVEWHSAVVVTMWRPRGRTGIYQFDILPVAEARTPTAFDKAFLEAGRRFWDPTAPTPDLDQWLDDLGAAAKFLP